MDLHLTTSQIDASVALRAYRLYKEGKCKEAIPVLIEILDVEPRNWQARLFLGASYARTDQPAAAQRAFRFTYENCPDTELKQKACLAMQAVAAQFQQKTINVPAEFGTLIERTNVQVARIEAIIY